MALPAHVAAILISVITAPPGTVLSANAAMEMGSGWSCGSYGAKEPWPCGYTLVSDRPEAKTASESTEGWRFVRTRHPQGGPDAISIMHTADTSKSDLDLAGLMLRCGDAGTEILVVLLRPFPLRARPEVTFGEGGGEIRYETTVAAPGTTVLLPVDAASLVNGPWNDLTELQIRVVDQQTSIRGVVPLAGLKSSFNGLMTNCRAR